MWYQEDIDESLEDELETIYCPYCMQHDYKNVLGRKILMPGEVRPDDYENYLECPTCYSVIPIHEGLKEETIKDAVETHESPFEDKLILQSIPKRSSPKGRRITAKRRHNKLKLDEDKEINDLLRKYGDNITVHK